MRLPGGVKRVEEPPLDIHHTVPFDWGRVCVTEYASKAYRFIPLNPDFVRGEIASDSQSYPKLSVYMVGPHEIEKEKAASTTHANETYQEAEFTCFSVGEIEGNDIKIKIALDTDLEGFNQRLMKALSDKEGIPEEEVPDTPTDDDIPIGEYVANNMSAAFVNAIQDSARETGRSILTNWRRSTDNANFMHRKVYTPLTRLGSLGVGAGIVELAQNSTAYYSGLGTLALGGLFLPKLAWDVRKYLSQSVDDQPTIDLWAAHVADTVGYDIYRTYSKEHFDSQWTVEPGTEGP